MNMIENRKAKAGQGGFTLIELLVVIAILGILAGVAVIGIGSMRASATQKVCEADMDTLETAAYAWLLEDANQNASNVGSTAMQTNLSGGLIERWPAKAYVTIDANGKPVAGGCS